MQVGRGGRGVQRQPALACACPEHQPLPARSLRKALPSSHQGMWQLVMRACRGAEGAGGRGADDRASLPAEQAGPFPRHKLASLSTL